MPLTWKWQLLDPEKYSWRREWEEDAAGEGSSILKDI
jgi:hypothetical protein